MRNQVDVVTNGGQKITLVTVQPQQALDARSGFFPAACPATDSGTWPSGYPPEQRRAGTAMPSRPFR
jgi:hypothetical protein